MSFSYHDNKLSRVSSTGVVDLTELCAQTSGPFYVYDLEGLKGRVQVFKEHLPKGASVHFAMKTNFNKKVLETVFSQNCGADLVSGGELRRALECGCLAQDIVFSGVGKTIQEIDAALEAGIKQINVESPQELMRISERARALKKEAPVAFRMNPDVNPETHPYIKTGFRENKFGMDESFLPELLQIVESSQGLLQLKGLTLHIGSQIRDLSPFEEAIRKTLVVHRELLSQGWALETFDVGGGVGISYESADLEEDVASIQEYGEILKRCFQKEDCQVLCEPGRIIVGRFGVLCTQVQYIKESPYKKFVIVDTGMHHLLRPSLYQAYHRILPMQLGKKATQVYDIVGPICESSDVLGHDRLLPEIQQGDWLAIADVGAYGAVMSSHYNLHTPPKEFAI